MSQTDWHPACARFFPCSPVLGTGASCSSLVGETFTITEKMNVEHEDEEFVDVESRGSEHNKQSNDPRPKFTGTKPSEFKSCRTKVRLWLLYTRTLQLSYKGRVF